MAFFLATAFLSLSCSPRCVASAVTSATLSVASFASAALTASSNGSGSILKSTSPFLIGRFGSIGTSVTWPFTRGTIGIT